jgi:low temperature requirement protein LtrA
MTLEEEGSTVEWLELFFDLVVVAAVAVLTEGLREKPTWGSLGLVALLYGAIWLSWISVVLYANVAGDRTRVVTVVAAMLLLAVMATTAPVHYEQRANLFAGAFLLVRGIAARGSTSTGRILAGWPLLQLGGLATLWVVAMWVPVPQKYWLWAAGLLVDLGFVLVRGGDHVDEQVERVGGVITRAG